MPDAKPSSSSDAGSTAALIAIGVALLLLVAVPLLLGLALFWAARRFLGRREAVVLLLAGAIGLVAARDYAAATYLHWLQTAFHVFAGSTSAVALLASAPWLTLALTSCLLVGLLQLLTETKVGAKFGRILPQHSTVRTRGGLFGPRTDEIDEDLLLDADTREGIIARSQVVTPPGGALTIDPSVHSIVDAGTQDGSRRFPIGHDAQGRPVTLSEKEVRTHGVILGSTGSGKSETIKNLMANLLDLGWDGLLLDLKEDTSKGGMRDWCAEYASFHGTPYQELRLSDMNSEYWFNALAGMSADEARDAILSLQEFEAAYYEALNKELLGQLLNLMFWAHDVDPKKFDYPTMYEVAKICGAPSLPNATKAMRATVMAGIPGLAEKDFLALSAPSKAQQESAVGFGSRLGNIFDSQAGRIVLRDNPDRPRTQVDVTHGGLTYIGLDSQGKADLTRVVSSSVLQRLSVYSSQRTTGSQEKTKPRFIIVDEANWVNREIVKNLLSRARGAGIALFLCTQGPNDWIDSKGDDWGTLVQNINVMIAMRQGAPEAALLCAEYFGKKKRQQVSERIEQTDSLLGERRVRGRDGKVVNSYTVSEDLDYRVPPDTFRELKIGQAYMLVGAPEHRSQFVSISMRDPRISPR